MHDDRQLIEERLEPRPERADHARGVRRGRAAAGGGLARSRASRSRPPRRSRRRTSRPRSGPRGVPPGARPGSISAGRSRPTGPGRHGRGGGRPRLRRRTGLLRGGPGPHHATASRCEGLHPRQTSLPLSMLGPDGGPAGPGDRVEFYVEGAANPEVLGARGFPPTARRPAGTDRPAAARAWASRLLYALARADLAVFHTEVWELVLDLEVLDGLQRAAARDASPGAREILRALSRALDVPRLRRRRRDGRCGPRRARRGAEPARARAARTGCPPSGTRTSTRPGCGRCARPCARSPARCPTWSRSREEYPELVFAFSPAQQHAWIKDHYPEVFASDSSKAVAAGNFVPVGGMWVESDTNMPGGEALARQFVHGKRFFLDEFGIDTQEVWLPDSFGYTAALPQLVKLSGSRWFLTQKISWNHDEPVPAPHVLVGGPRRHPGLHPLPAGRHVQLRAVRAPSWRTPQRNFAEKGAATRSLVPFGYGDGGGGPTREMLATARRVGRPGGLAAASRSSRRPTFFAAAEAEYADAAGVVRRAVPGAPPGTYTCQAQDQAGQPAQRAPAARGRAVVGGRGGRGQARRLPVRGAGPALEDGAAAPVPRHPAGQLDRLGAPRGRGDLRRGRRRPGGDHRPGAVRRWPTRAPGRTVVFNAAPHAARRRPRARARPRGRADPAPRPSTIDGRVLDNGLLRVTVDERGLVTSVVDVAAGREVLAPGRAANLLQLHLGPARTAGTPGTSTRTTATPVRDLTEVDAVDARRSTAASRPRSWRGRSAARRVDPDAAAPAGRAAARRRVPTSTGTSRRSSSRPRSRSTSTPTARPRRPSSATSSGRPTRNTSWDAAKFEICAHRWLHVGEPGYGVAVVNDSTYGHDVTRTTRRRRHDHHRPAVAAARAAVPRPGDRPGPRTCSATRWWPGAGIADAVREGYRINLPERVVAGGIDGRSSRSSSSSATATTTTTATATARASYHDQRQSGSACAIRVHGGDDSHDGDGIVVEAVEAPSPTTGPATWWLRPLRIHRRPRPWARLTTGFEVTGVEETDLLERPLATRDPTDGGVGIELRPFQVLTLRLKRAAT